MSIAGRLSQRRRVRAKRRAEVEARARAVRSDMGRQAGAVAPAPSKATPAKLHHIYSSRDDALSVFEDAAGHVVAVRSRHLV